MYYKSPNMYLMHISGIYLYDINDGICETFSKEKSKLTNFVMDQKKKKLC
jgi:hypothetical protein